MEIHFHKYQGTGNDFILIDDRLASFEDSDTLIQKLCNRKFGIGADGLILIQHHPELDYRMVFFNPDGSQSLCGNGSRCGFAFAQALGIVDDQATFETTDGIHQIKKQDGLIHFQLRDITEKRQINEKEWYLNTGSPHVVALTDDLAGLDVRFYGQAIRYSDPYSSQNGTNVNFAQLLTEKVKIRTYERGVEDETLSCGTGATAVGLLVSSMGYESPVTVDTEGGELKVFFKKEKERFTDIWLAGPAEKVFAGSIMI